KQTFIANFLNLSEEEKQPFVSYRVEKKESLDQIANKFNLSPNEILLANKLPSSTKYLRKGTVLKIPLSANYQNTTKNEIESDNLNPISFNNTGITPSNVAENKTNSSPTTSVNVIRYIVKENDNLIKISQKYNVEADSLIIWNELRTNTLTPGQTLRIYTIENPNNTTKQAKNLANENPIPKETTPNSSANNLAQDVPKEQTKVKTRTAKYHKVQKGETLQQIADKYKVDINQVLEWNPSLKKRKHNIIVGERIKIIINSDNNTTENNTAQSTKPSPKSKNKYHIVRRGENFSTISKKYGISVQKLISLNPNINPNKIKHGDKIRID
ncbi:MAG: LysM peptidoglycan-binding domain-containing protein, partial [Candidatus Kapaibacteriota bacterium]